MTLRRNLSDLLFRFLSFFALIFCLPALGQNLVPNPGFEILNNCPTGLDQIDEADDWFSPGTGIADLFNTCAAGNAADVPSNLQGSQTPNGGNGYAGIFVFGDEDLREYLSVELNSPLEVGTTYCIEYWVSAGDFFGSGIQDLGFFFSENIITSDNDGPLNAVPQFANTNGPIEEATDWVSVSSQFVADAAYQYLTIGNFFDNANTVGGNSTPGTPFAEEVYYYVDDVSVVAQASPLSYELTDASCDSETVTLTASGGSGAYTWLNLDNPDVPLSFEETLTISVNTETTILLSSDSGSCELTETISLFPATQPIVNIQVNNPCGGFPTEILAQVSNLSEDATYAWEIFEAGATAATFISTNIGSISTILPVGEYTATLTVTNNDGCSDDISTNFTVDAECDECSDYVNLVPNGNFEALSECPETLGALFNVDFWDNATSASPDYFNACATQMSGVSVPDNDLGFQNAADGNAYAGFFAFGEQNFREYITIELPTPTQAGITYCFSYETSLSDESTLAVNNIGALFSPGSISIVGSGFISNLPFSPQIESNDIITDSENWTTVTETFVADGTFTQLTMGNFRSNGSTAGQIVDNTGELVSYYYIDNVKLYEVPSLTINSPTASCIGVNISATVNDEFCDYRWFEIDDPETTLGNEASFEIPTNSAGTNQYVVNAVFGDCVIADTLNFEVFPLPNASFTSPGGCVGTLTPFIVPSPPPGESFSYDWDVDNDGDIDLSSDNSTGFVFEEAGTFTVNVLVQSSGGCVNGNSIEIVIEEDCPDCSENSLIINGSFETLTTCPDDFGQIQNASAWISTAADDADLFATCSGDGTNVGVPTNAFGFQVPTDESLNYAGITVFGPDDQRSFLTIPLLTPVTPGQTYCASFDVSLAELSGIALDEIGLYFSNDVPTNILGSSPQITSGNEEILDEKDAWTTISGSFTASSEFEFVTIGNFATNANTNTFIQPQGIMSNVAYYYLDNIRLITTEISIPENVVVCQGESTELFATSDFCEHEWVNVDNPNDILSAGASVIVSPESTTTYRYAGLNGNCSAEALVEVVVIPAPSAGEDRNLCPNESLLIALSGIDNATDIVWSPNNGIDVSDPANPVFTTTETTTYTVSVTYPEASDCPTTDEITITPIAEFAVVSEVLGACIDGSTQLFASGGDSYSWSPTTGLDDPNSPSPIASPATSTTYTVSVTDDSTGCTSQLEVFVPLFECDEGGPVWLNAAGDTTDMVLFDTLLLNTTDTTFLPSFFDPDLPEDVVTLSFDGPENGVFQFLVDSAFYTPDLDFFGMDTVSMVACDSLFPIECDTTLIVYTILPPPNQPPTLNGPETIMFDAVADSSVLFCPDIIDPDGDEVMLVFDPQDIEGEIEIINSVCFNYTGPDDFIGEDSFVISICDENDACTNVTVSVDVLDRTLIANDDFVNVFINDPVNVVVLNNDSLPDVGFDEIFLIEEPEQGTIEPTDTSFFYFPEMNYIGPDTFQYAICGNTWGCDTATVHIQVINFLAGTDDNFFGAPDEQHIIEVLNNDFIPFGDCVTINVLEQPMNGTIEEVILTIIYQPDPGFVGTDQIVYEVCCPGFGCDIATVSIIITTLLPPIAEDDIISIGADTDVSIEVLGNDSDPNGESLSSEILMPPLNGDATLEGNSIIYSPDPGFMGIDSLLYQACNETNLCTEAFVFITVGEVSNEPCDLWFPEAFSPNGDGINETFYISGIDNCQDLQNNEFRVFNRWGNIVFEAEDYGVVGDLWDGTYQETGEDVTVGTYFYILRKPNAPRNENFHGTVEVFR